MKILQTNLSLARYKQKTGGGHYKLSYQKTLILFPPLDNDCQIITGDVDIANALINYFRDQTKLMTLMWKFLMSFSIM